MSRAPDSQNTRFSQAGHMSQRGILEIRDLGVTLTGR